MITHEIVKELLSYNAETGIFKWNERHVKYFDDTESRTAEHNRNNWNARYAHKEAGSDDHKGYLLISIFNILYKAHRLAWLYETGEFPCHVIDHTNGCRHDNRFVNLRSTAQLENCKNKKIYNTNKSGVPGVVWDKRCNKWRAYIGICGSAKHLGRFVSMEDAISARLSAEKNYGFHANHGRISQNE